MKKIIFSLLTCLILFASILPVEAANKAASITSASANTTKVTVAGTSEAVAVTVQVRSQDGKILTMDTVGTQNQKYSIEIDKLSLTEGSTYTVYAADYEGGTWAKQDVVAKSASTGSSLASDTTANTSKKTKAKVSKKTAKKNATDEKTIDEDDSDKAEKADANDSDDQQGVTDDYASHSGIAGWIYFLVAGIVAAAVAVIVVIALNKKKK